MVRLTIGIALLSLLGSSACQEPPSGPKEVYLAFHRAISNRDWDRAVSFLAPETKNRFQAVGVELAGAVGYQGDPLAFFLRGVRAEVRTPLRQVEVLEQEGDRSVVRVVAGECSEEAGSNESADNCKVADVRLERVDGRWLIAADLPAALQGPPEPGGGG